MMVADIIAAANKLAGRDLRIHDQRRKFTPYRMAAYAACRQATGKSFPLIGKMFNRDHSTVVSGMRNANPELVEMILCKAREVV